MSSVDIQTVERLARAVYTKCRDCQGEYRSLAIGVRQVQNSLQDVEDGTTSRQLDSVNEVELRGLIQSCDEVLKELSDLVDRYNDLPLQSKRTWERLNWDQGDGVEIQKRLSRAADQLTKFYQGLRDSPTAQIELALEQLAKEISNGRHETTTATSLSTTAVDPEDDEGWYQIIRDLGDLGVQESVVNEYRAFIVDWILKAVNRGALTDEKIPVESSQEAWSQSSPPPIPPKTPVLHLRTVSASGSAHRSPPLPTIERRHISSTPPIYHRPSTPPYLVTQEQDRLFVDVSTLRPAVSSEALYRETTINMDEPPSPIEDEFAESNMLWNAQRICDHWNRREWRQARENLEAQIQCVERGEFVQISGFPQQPEIRILRHLLGVCHSFAGDFIQAREAFQSVLQGVYIQGLPLDDGDIAAARWLAETCILSNQPYNATFAWAIAYRGLKLKYPPGLPGHQHASRMLDDIRALNIKTNALNTLRNIFVNSNRDATTILGNMAGTHKFDIVASALDDSRVPQMSHAPVRLSQDIKLAEGFLIQPLVAQTSWPFQQDPLFRRESAVDLLHALSRPRITITPQMVSSISLGSSKTLVYLTKQSIEWLVEAIKYALNTYAIEWKVRHGEYLLRLSQTHERIAYYDCFSVKFKKLRLRNTYGFKVGDRMYMTRSFNTPTESKEKIRAELAERLRDYVQQAERDMAAGGKWPPEDALQPSTAIHELASMPVEPGELEARGREWELDSQAVQRKPQNTLPSYEIAELPG